MGAPNPLAQLVMSQLQARAAQGGGAPGGPPGPGGGPPGMPGSEGGDPAQMYAQQVSELKGADPGQLLDQLKKMKQIMAVMLVQNLERLPNVSGKISKLIPQFDAVIKEVQQASSVNQAVRNPIQMGAAQPQQPEGQGTAQTF